MIEYQLRAKSLNSSDSILLMTTWDRERVEAAKQKLDDMHLLCDFENNKRDIPEQMLYPI